MPRAANVRRYGKPSKRSKAERLFAELPQSPVRRPAAVIDDAVTCITEQLSAVDGIVKIAEASFAEVYRVSNERGTIIIKVIRLESPIKPQTKAQVRAGLVGEEPHGEDEVDGELLISEWLADVPGFVVYKERYVVRGRAMRQLLATHQDFHRRARRQDPGRAQFYPSPSRYLDGTWFLVVELGDAGTALEDWTLADKRELWDILLLEAVALARAEDLVMFEVSGRVADVGAAHADSAQNRDLHEGNLCVRRVRPARAREEGGGVLGRSGLDITILDYGLSRAEDTSGGPVAADLERDLGLFTSTHAPQCRVYRQMRLFPLRGGRACIPPEGHRTPYARGAGGPLS